MAFASVVLMMGFYYRDPEDQVSFSVFTKMTFGHIRIPPSSRQLGLEAVTIDFATKLTHGRNVRAVRKYDFD
jgi:hypothetical protein